MKLSAELAFTLLVVVEEGSLDAAARRLHVTPSAVSQRVKAIEQQAGRVLLVRSKPVRATEAAEPVLRYARQLTLLEDEAERALGQSDAQVATISLAVNADSLSTWFLRPLARLAEVLPVTFDLHRDDQDFTAGLLESGTVSAAVTSQTTPVAGCRVSPLGGMRYEAVATPGFLARWLPHGGTAKELDRAPRVDFDRRDDLQAQWLEARGGHPAQAPRHFVPASHDFARAIELGLGWGMLPRLQSAEALASGALAPLGGPPIDVPLSWQQWNLHSTTLAAIADEVAAEAARVLAPL